MRVESRPAGVVATLAAMSAVLIAGCASVPTRSFTPAPLADAGFHAEGRISARHGNDAVSASFRWDHTPPRDELELLTPLGQTVARLSGDASTPFARVETSDGNSLEAQDWPALTTRALGFPLPVAGLAAWVRGAPRPGSHFDAEGDAEGRLALLRQDGWEITFDYPDEARRTPSRLRLTYPEVDVRLALDRVE